MMDKAIEMALGGDRDMMRMLMEYRLGKPQVNIDQRLSIDARISADDLREELVKIREEEVKLLTEAAIEEVEGEWTPV